MVMVYTALLLEAAKMLRYTVGAEGREPNKLANILEAASRGENIVWPPKDYKPIDHDR